MLLIRFDGLHVLCVPLVGADIDALTLGARDAVAVQFRCVEAASGVDSRGVGQQVQVETCRVDKKVRRISYDQVLLFTHTCGVGEGCGQVVAHHAFDGRHALFMMADANPGRPGPDGVKVQHGIVDDQTVTRPEQGDAVPVVGDDDIVLNHPVHKGAVEAANALKGSAMGLVQIFVVDDGVAPQHETHDLAAAHAVGADGPGLKAVVVIAVDVVAILHGVVLERAVVAEPAQTVAREVLDEIAGDEGMAGVHGNAKVHVQQAIVADCHPSAVHLESVAGQSIPLIGRPGGGVCHGSNRTILHHNVMDGAGPVVAVQVDEGVSRIGLAEFGADGQPANRPVGAGPDAQRRQARGVPWLGRNRDGACVVIPQDG